MLDTPDWMPLDVPDLDALPRPVVPRSQHLGARRFFPPHAHRWHQLVYATSGTLVVAVDGAWHVISPEQAIWVPTGVTHATGALADAAFRNLYVADGAAPAMPRTCTVYGATPLLRALVVERDAAGRRGEPAAYLDQVDALLLAQLPRLAVQDFHLPWPRSARLCRLCEALHANPADARSIHEWGRELGASARTLSRRFEQEVGLSLRDWRHRLRLYRAVEWLCAGRGVTEIALALGYASPSAFTYMFRRAMGRAPTQWRAA